MQLIYTRNTKKCSPNFDFPRDFKKTFTENHWSNIKKAVEHQKTKEKHRYPKREMSLVIMDTSKSQHSNVVKEFYAKSFCDFVIVPHSLTNKSQPLDISVNKAAKSFFF